MKTIDGHDDAIGFGPQCFRGPKPRKTPPVREDKGAVISFIESVQLILNGNEIGTFRGENTVDRAVVDFVRFQLYNGSANAKSNSIELREFENGKTCQNLHSFI